MAKRKQYSAVDVTGLSIRDIMDIDLDTFNSLNERELKQLTSRLVSASNKRIRRMEERGINSPAMQSLGSDKTFSVKLPPNVSNKQRVNKLRSEFARARNFLGMRTSTLGGYRKYEREVRVNLESDIGRKLTADEINTAYKILHKMQQSGEVAGRKTAGSYQARKMIFEQLYNNPDTFDDELMEDVRDEYNEYYDKNPEEQFESYR